MLDADVIIVGLGPTGTSTAALMGQRGLSVLGFEKGADLFPLPRAIGFDHEVMRVMQELKIAERVLPHTAAYRPSEYRGLAGQVIRRIEAAPLPNRLAWESNYVFDQPAFERELRRRALELNSVGLYFSSAVSSVGQDEDKVWADIPRSDGTCRRYTARYLIACDGGSSPIRKALGVGLDDLGFDEPWLVVDAIVGDEKISELPQTQVQYCEPSRPATFVVGPGNHRRWEIMLLPGDSLSVDFPESQLWPLLSRWIKPGDARLWRAAAYRFHGLVTTQWRKGRVLFAGDSAHMTPPFLSQGMVQGIRDGQNLAWKMQRVLSGSSPDSLLDTYEEERKPHVISTTLVAMSLGREICERDPVKARERDARLLAAHDGGPVRPTIRQNLIPGLSAGRLVTKTPGAGTLLPQPRVHEPNAPHASLLLDDLTGATLRVLVTAPLHSEDATKLSNAAQAYDARLVRFAGNDEALLATDFLIEEEGLLNRWLGELGQSFVVARPDHYVFGTATTADAAVDLLAALARELRRDTGRVSVPAES